MADCYLVWDDESREAMLIDPGSYEPQIRELIENEGLLLKYIALTHGHGDHIAGVPGFKEAFPGASIAIGAEDLPLVGDTDMNDSGAWFGEKTVFAPDILLREGDSLKLGPLEFQVIETPGHTPGGLSFYIKDNDRNLTKRDFSGTAFTGDTLFHASTGRTDLPGGDFSVLKASIREKLFKLPDDTLLLPGHMEATTVEFEKKYNPYVG